MFCMAHRVQMSDGMCGCPRCYALQVQGVDWASREGGDLPQCKRSEGKLCFMELTEAVVASHPKLLAVGDIINTATWGRFVVRDHGSKHWLNDYSLYFADVCHGSWDRVVALHARPRVERVHARNSTFASTCSNFASTCTQRVHSRVLPRISEYLHAACTFASTSSIWRVPSALLVLQRC